MQKQNSKSDFGKILCSKDKTNQRQVLNIL